MFAVNQNELVQSLCSPISRDSKVKAQMPNFQNVLEKGPFFIIWLDIDSNCLLERNASDLDPNALIVWHP